MIFSLITKCAYYYSYLGLVLVSVWFFWKHEEKKEAWKSAAQLKKVSRRSSPLKVLSRSSPLKVLSRSTPLPCLLSGLKLASCRGNCLVTCCGTCHCHLSFKHKIGYWLEFIYHFCVFHLGWKNSIALRSSFVSFLIIITYLLGLFFTFIDLKVDSWTLGL